jgi:hypothetical protein
MTHVLAGQHVPIAALHTILGSLGGALAVAGTAGGATGALLAHAARAAFMSGNGAALAAGAAVALGGALLVLTRLPSRASRDEPDPCADPPEQPVSASHSDAKSGSQRLEGGQKTLRGGASAI